MALYDKRDMRFRNPSPLYKATSAATDPRGAQSVSPLSLARTATSQYAAAEPPQPASTGPQAGDPYRDVYGTALTGAESAVRALPGALSAARAAQERSLADREALAKGYIDGMEEPKDGTWGRFGASLLKPTSTGSFFEAYGNAASEAMNARERYHDQKQLAAERKYIAQDALHKLMADRPNAALQGLEDQVKILDTTQRVDDLRGDYDLRNGLTPQGDEALLADARANPGKYRSPRGQSLIADAQGRVTAAAKTADERSWWLQQQEYQSRLKREEEAAKRAAGGVDLSPSEEKMVMTAHGNVVATQDNLALLDEADRLDQSGAVMGGYAPRQFAAAGKVLSDYLPEDYAVPDWLFGSPEQRAATQSYYQVLDPASLERIKASLPGVMTDRDLRFALGVYADPNATPEARQQARDTIRSRFQAQDKVSRAQLNRLLGPGGSADLLGEAPMPEGDGGQGGNQRYLTPDQGSTLKQAIQHAQQNKAWGGVAKRLNEMGFTITPEQLRSLTPEQVDQLIRSGQ